MVDTNKLLTTIRMGVIGVVSFFSIIVFCISVHLVWLTNTVARRHWTFAALSLATALITLATLPIMYFISKSRKGAVTSYIAAELGWLSFLWILWIASAGSAATLYWVNAYTGGVASEAQAIEAFGFLNWIILLVYTITLLVYAILAHNKGNPDVWTSSVDQFDFNAARSNQVPPVSTAAPQFDQKVETTQTYYPPPQVQQQPQQPYPTGLSAYSGTPTNYTPTSPQV